MALIYTEHHINHLFQIAPQTKSYLEGKLPQEIHPSLVNSRKRARIVKAEKEKVQPGGTGIAGMICLLPFRTAIHLRSAAAVYGLLESSKAGPAEERYVRSVHVLSNGAEIVVGLNPDLAVLLHSARWLMVDTTFKPVHGDTNEWKIVIWTAGTRQRE